MLVRQKAKVSHIHNVKKRHGTTKLKRMRGTAFSAGPMNDLSKIMGFFMHNLLLASSHAVFRRENHWILFFKVFIFNTFYQSSRRRII